MKIKNILLLLLSEIVFFVFIPISANGQVAQEVSISGSPNPVGSGARALGMGGAFIAVADDATAASWNPGGLIQLETPEVSVVLSHERRSDERTFIKNPGASGTFSLELQDINYLSAAWPFTVRNYNMIVSLNYQTLYDFNKKITTNYQYAQPFPGPSGARQTSKEIKGYLKALSPAFAMQVTPSLSAGFTVNWFSRDFKNRWETEYKDSLNGTFAGFPYFADVWYYDEYVFEGLNYNLGVMWNLNSVFTLGFVYKAPLKADVHYKEMYTVSATMQKTPLTVVMDEDQVLEMPQSYGVGIACRFSDTFTVDLDFYQTDWQHFVLRQADGRELSLITGQDRSACDTEPTRQVRLGAEYLLIRNNYVIPFRAGIFSDPEPTAYEPEDFYGVSVGSGIAIGSFVFDAAYQYRWGDQVRKIRLGTETVMQDIEQHTFYVSLIYHF